MTSDLPAAIAAGMANAAGGGVAAPTSASGARTTPIAQKEILMTNDTPRLEWRTGYQHRGHEPVDTSALDYLLDGDDPLARAARASVRILPNEVAA